MKLNIRCCCTPEKIFGHLELPDDLPRDEQILHVPLFHTYPRSMLPVVETELVRSARIEVKWIYWHSHDSIGDQNWRELAVYSDDRSKEFWSTVLAFRPGPVPKDEVVKERP